jgi:hypothetical protein
VFGFYRGEHENYGPCIFPRAIFLSVYTPLLIEIVSPRRSQSGKSLRAAIILAVMPEVAAVSIGIVFL